MKHLSCVSIKCGIAPLLAILLFANCTKEKISTQPVNSESTIQLKDGSQSIGAAQILSQTRTASYLNNLNNFLAVVGDQGFPRVKPETVSADDGKYATSSKLTANGNSVAPMLVLQGFGFTIPDNATIENIALKVRRFKSGSPAIGDHSLSLMQRFECQFGPCVYGVFWTFEDDYPGRMYPNTETEYIFPQSGSGNNGGFEHDLVYQWTPAIVNHQYFGVRIKSQPPSGKGSVVVNYDLVNITVQYSLP